MNECYIRKVSSFHVITVPLILAAVLAIVVSLPSTALGLEWSPPGTSVSGEGFFGLRRADIGNISYAVRYFECSSTVSGKTPPYGSYSPELSLTYKPTGCHTDRGETASISSPTGPIVLIATWHSLEYNWRGGGSVLIPYGTKYTITVNLGITTCTFKVGEPSGSYTSGGFTLGAHYGSELSINGAPVPVTISGTGQYASMLCGTSGTWYLDTLHQTWPGLQIK